MSSFEIITVCFLFVVVVMLSETDLKMLGKFNDRHVIFCVVAYGPEQATSKTVGYFKLTSLGFKHITVCTYRDFLLFCLAFAKLFQSKSPKGRFWDPKFRLFSSKKRTDIFNVIGIHCANVPTTIIPSGNNKIAHYYHFVPK